MSRGESEGLGVRKMTFPCFKQKSVMSTQDVKGTMKKNNLVLAYY